MGCCGSTAAQPGGEGSGNEGNNMKDMTPAADNNSLSQNQMKTKPKPATTVEPKRAAAYTETETEPLKAGAVGATKESNPSPREGKAPSLAIPSNNSSPLVAASPRKGGLKKPGSSPRRMQTLSQNRKGTGDVGAEAKDQQNQVSGSTGGEGVGVDSKHNSGAASARSKHSHSRTPRDDPGTTTNTNTNTTNSRPNSGKGSRRKKKDRNSNRDDDRSGDHSALADAAQAQVSGNDNADHDNKQNHNMNGGGVEGEGEPGAVGEDGHLSLPANAPRRGSVPILKKEKKEEPINSPISMHNRKVNRSSGKNKVKLEPNGNGNMPPLLRPKSQAEPQTHGHGHFEGGKRSSRGRGHERGASAAEDLLKAVAATPQQHSARRHSLKGQAIEKRKKKRRTSNRGMMNNLALKFPLIRKSFMAVYKAFEKSMLAPNVPNQNRLKEIPTTPIPDGMPLSPAADMVKQADEEGKENIAMNGAQLPVRINNLTTPERNQLSSTPSAAGGARDSITGVRDLGTITVDKLKYVLEGTLEHQKQFTEEEIKRLFKLADLDDSKSISFREFLIIVAVGYFLKGRDDKDKAGAKETKVEEGTVLPIGSAPVSPQNKASTAATDSSSSADASSSPLASSHASTLASSTGVSIDVDEYELPQFKEIQRGFRVVEQAFKDMDDDGSNTVDVNELKNALFSATFDSDKALLERRFAELDFNGDGDVEFPEFLYGVVSWVGFMDDDEEMNRDMRS